MTPAMAPAHDAIAFIEAARREGATDEFIARLLREHGWSEKQIAETFTVWYEGKTGHRLPEPHVSRGENAKDAFLYLLSFATLGTWVIAVGSLVFTFINYYVADPASTYDYYGGYTLNVSNELAAIIVAFPVYLLVMHFLMKDIGRNAEKSESAVRKWLTYLTLFIAAGVTIGDLITFLAYFLSGEVTLRFSLKVLTVLILAGGVFWYYLAAVRAKRQKAPVIASEGVPA